MFRRRQPWHPQIEQIREAFSPVALHIDRAQRALLAAVPKPRDDGAPLAQALATFSKELAGARAAMDSWRHPATEELWKGCMAALDQAAAAGESLRLGTHPATFEALNEAVGVVLHPLEEFADTDRALRRI